MKRSWLIFGLFVAGGALVAGLVLLYKLPLELRERSPIQPLAFSHKLHAGDNGIHCLFCHRYAERSPVAGIPAVSFCMTCHPTLRPGDPGFESVRTKTEADPVGKSLLPAGPRLFSAHDAYPRRTRLCRLSR